MADWINAKDQMPEEGDALLIVIKSYVRPTIGFYEDGEWWQDDDEEPLSESNLKVTHWQPLPELPTP